MGILNNDFLRFPYTILVSLRIVVERKIQKRRVPKGDPT